MRLLTWAQDGYDRRFLCKKGENNVLFCGLAGISGMELVWLYEDFRV